MDHLRPTSSWVHLCIDMQRIFAAGGLWPTPWMERVLPNVAKIAERHPSRTIFTRFVTPRSPDEASGAWRPYYRKWISATRDHIDPAQLQLVDPLGDLGRGACVIDKMHYSAFVGSTLLIELRNRGAAGIIVTGSETDVCVLSTVMSAVDFGIPVVVVEDGICSSSDAGHDALIATYNSRFSCQVATMRTQALLDIWQ